MVTAPGPDLRTFADPVDPGCAWLWRRLPNRLRRHSTTAADVMSAGRWLAAHRLLGLLSPAIAAVVGVGLGWQHADISYIQSLSVMAVLVVIGMVSASLGAWALLGFMIGDWLLHPADAVFQLERLDVGAHLYQYDYPRLVSYVVLGLLVVVNPLVARGLGRRLRDALGGRTPLGHAADVALTAGVAAVLTYLWTQSAQYLVRPIWTLSAHIDRLPQFVTFPVNVDRDVIVICAATASTVGVVGSVIAERLAPARLRALVPAPIHPVWVAPPVLAAGFKGVLSAVLVTGVLESVTVWLAFAAGISAVELARTTLLARLPVLPPVVDHVPLLVRIVVALALSRVVGAAILSPEIDAETESFAPLIIAALAAYGAASLMFPGAGARRSTRVARGRVTSMVIVAFAVVVTTTLGGSAPAGADDCRNLADCAISASGANWALAGLVGALLGAVVLSARGPSAPRSPPPQKPERSRPFARLPDPRRVVRRIVPPPEPERVAAAFDKARHMAFEPVAGGVGANCVGAVAAVETRLAGGRSHIVAAFGDQISGAPLRHLEAVANGHRWGSSSPAEAAAWVVETGGRGILHVEWPGGSAHLLNVVGIDGEVFFVDASQPHPALSSTFDGLFPPEAHGAGAFNFLATWPPG